MESERGVSMGLLGGKERCEAKVGQMVAYNEVVEVEGRRGVVLLSGKGSAAKAQH